MAALEAIDKKIGTMDANLILTAAYLDPFIKSQLGKVSEIVPQWNKDQAIEAVRRFAQKFGNGAINQRGSRESDFIVEEMNPLESELQSYTTLPMLNIDPLVFWSENANVYPILSKVAKEILCIPASSVTSERAFSTLGLVATDLRNRLSTEKTSALIMMRSLIKSGLMSYESQ